MQPGREATQDTMDATGHRQTAWRGGGAIVVATVTACLYCAATSVETVPAGLFVCLPVAFSVVLFLALERSCASPWPKYVGFLAPVLLIVGGLLHSYWSLRLRSMQGEPSDFGADLPLFLVQFCGIGNSFALAWLLTFARHSGTTGSADASMVKRSSSPVAKLPSDRPR